MSDLHLGAAPLVVLLDLRNPFSFLALGPTRALVAELGVEADWLPIVNPPLKPPSAPTPDDDRGVRHRRSRAQALARDIQTYAEAQGLVIHDYYRAPDTELANRAWLFLQKRNPDRLVEYLGALFRGYWSGELDPSQGDAIAALLDEIGESGANFARWSEAEGARTTAALAETLSTRGWFQAPGFVVEEEVFYGRQHLPMLRWILEGRTGPVPI